MQYIKFYGVSTCAAAPSLQTYQKPDGSEGKICQLPTIVNIGRFVDGTYTERSEWKVLIPLISRGAKADALAKAVVGKHIAFTGDVQQNHRKIPPKNCPHCGKEAVPAATAVNYYHILDTWSLTGGKEG